MNVKKPTHILTMMALFGCLMAIHPSHVQAQYYIKKHAEEETEATKSNKPSIFIKRHVKTPKEPQKKQPEELTSRFEGIDRSDVQKFMEDTFGKCTMDDLKIIGLSKIGFEEYEKQLNEFVDENRESGAYDFLADLDIEALRKSYEETEKLPEEFKDMVKNQPEEAMKTLNVILEDIQLSEIVGANTRCMNVDELMKSPALSRYIKK